MSEIWWDAVKAYYTEKYPGCSIEKPRAFPVRLPSGRTLQIANTWYDVLVSERFHSGESGSSTSGIHCVEVKWSEKGAAASFGAFTIGEWMLARLALDKDENGLEYSYEILLVWRERAGRIITEELPLSAELLDEMLAYPQIKLYFHADFIERHRSRPSEGMDSSRTTSARPNRIRREPNSAIQSIRDSLKSALREILEI